MSTSGGLRRPSFRFERLYLMSAEARDVSRNEHLLLRAVAKLLFLREVDRDLRALLSLLHHLPLRDPTVEREPIFVRRAFFADRFERRRVLLAEVLELARFFRRE